MIDSTDYRKGSIVHFITGPITSLLKIIEIDKIYKEITGELVILKDNEYVKIDVIAIIPFRLIDKVIKY